MHLGIDARRALVCGASKGLGYACAEELAREGAQVTLVARNEIALAQAHQKVAAFAPHPPDLIVADLTRAEDRARVLKHCGALDILITNCGGPPSKDFRTLTLDDWQAALEVNFLSAVELIKATIQPMIAHGFGRIVNITSLTVRMPVEALDLSTAPRLALTGYVAGVARQVAAHGVTINNVLPGAIMTERIAALGDIAQSLVARAPAGRAGRPNEFAAICAFLCSAQAGYITAQNILVDGGLCVFNV